MKIVLDAMGGDHAPYAVVAGAVEALKQLDTDIILVGIEDQVTSELKKYIYPKERVEVIHAPEVVDMDDPAISSVRKKRNSSIGVGIKVLKEKNYDAFVSAGNTGAVVAASSLTLGMLSGVERPAIGLVLPTLKNFSFLIDIGANTEPKSEHLLQWALMAQVYMKEVLGVNNPSVGLLNIGEESCKGSGFQKETHKLMEDRLNNFIGNVEANEVYAGKSDCIICDGYTGNVLIKVSQSIMESAGALIKREVVKSPLAMIGAYLMKSRLNHIKKLADYSEYGGAPLLGVNGLVMICHGRSTPKAIKNAIRATAREVEHNILERMSKEFK